MDEWRAPSWQLPRASETRGFWVSQDPEGTTGPKSKMVLFTEEKEVAGFSLAKEDKDTKKQRPLQGREPCSTNFE